MVPEACLCCLHLFPCPENDIPKNILTLPRFSVLLNLTKSPNVTRHFIRIIFLLNGIIILSIRSLSIELPKYMVEEKEASLVWNANLFILWLNPNRKNSYISWINTNSIQLIVILILRKDVAHSLTIPKVTTQRSIINSTYNWEIWQESLFNEISINWTILLLILWEPWIFDHFYVWKHSSLVSSC